jgi:hypothetical protein
LNAPVAVGVPEMVPLEEMVKPGGRPVAVNVYGPLTPPLPTIVAGTIGLLRTAVMPTQFAVGATGAVAASGSSMKNSCARRVGIRKGRNESSTVTELAIHPEFRFR